MSLEKTLEKFYQGIAQDTTIFLGLSGGADSVALFELTSKLTNNQKIIALHVNHKLRGTESDKDQQLCYELCATKGIKLISKEINIAAIAKESRQNLEDTARNERRAFFLETAQNYSKPILLLAHHQNDQVETILMRLLRNSGWRGLAGIKSESIILPANPHTEQPLRIFRPLLHTTRGDLINYLKYSGIKWREDKSNSDTKFTRNRLRHKILPALKKLLPDSEQTLLELAKNANNVDSKIYAIANNIKCSVEYGGVFFALNAFDNFPPEVCIRAIESAIHTHLHGPILRSSSFKNILNVISGRQSASNLAAGYFMRRENDGFFIFHQSRKQLLQEKSDIRGDAYNFTYTDNFTSIDAQTVSIDSRNLTNKNKTDIEYLNLTNLSLPLSIRRPQVGDRIKLKNGNKKISDIFTDQKIPQRKRECALIIADQKSIIWLAPYKLASRAFLPAFAADSIKISFSLK